MMKIKKCSDEPATVSAKHILVDTEELCSEIKEKIENSELTFEEAANAIFYMSIKRTRWKFRRIW